MSTLHGQLFSVILAAGRGDRLRPITDTIPKPLIEVRGRPCIDWIVSSLLAAGIEKNCVVVGHLASRVREHFRKPHFASAAVTFADQEGRTGTASALQSAGRVMSREIETNTPVLVTAADYVVPEGFVSTLLAHYFATRPDILIVTREISLAAVPRKSVVAIGSNGAILRIDEKPSRHSDGRRTSAVLMFIAPSRLIHQCHTVDAGERGERDVQSALNSMIRSGCLARAFPTTEIEDLESLIQV